MMQDYLCNLFIEIHEIVGRQSLHLGNRNLFVILNFLIVCVVVQLHAVQLSSVFCVGTAVLNTTRSSLWGSNAVILWLFGVRLHLSRCLFTSL